MKGDQHATTATIEVSRRGVTAHEAEMVLSALGGLRYGSVEVVIHDGRVVQIERKEKVRLDR